MEPEEPEHIIPSEWLDELIKLLQDTTADDRLRLRGCVWVLKKMGITRDDEH